jgi:FkbH-like protein
MKKMLILDCDNTLWGGIVGEDGVDGIDLSPDTPEGAIFLEVQALIKGFSKAGVLIALCSKNSLEDVDNVLKRHPRMILSDHDISMKTINWNDKVDNIRLIATTMNIGLDSLVFLDDSLFEIEHVRSFLPEVSTFRVPEKLYEYPALIREISGLFYNGFQTQEDLSKQEMYRQNFERVSFKGEFDSLDDYLASLNVKLVCYDNNPSLAPRMAQLSQKTNQFNLTTIRYTERQIEDFIADPNYDVLSYRVKDKFGDSGVTILVILRYAFHLHTAVVDSFLMSCRIIGRNIEFSVMNHIVKQMQGKGLYYIEADYIPTTKNALTASFYDKCSFQLLGASDHPGKKYKLSIKDYQPMDVTYEVVYEREN